MQQLSKIKLFNRYTGILLFHRFLLDISRAEQYKMTCYKDCAYHANTQKVIISKRKNNPPKTGTAIKAMDIPPLLCSFVPNPSSASRKSSKLLLSANEVPLQRISETGGENGSALDSVSELSNSKSFVSPDAYLFRLKEDLSVSPSNAIPWVSVDFDSNFFLLNFISRRSDANFTSASAFLIDSVNGIMMTVTITSKGQVNLSYEWPKKKKRIQRLTSMDDKKLNVTLQMFKNPT